MGAAWLWGLADIRRRWPSLIAVGLLIAVAVGSILAMVVGAWRANSVLERYAKAVDLPEVLVSTETEAAAAQVADSLEGDPRIARVEGVVGLTAIRPAPIDFEANVFIIVGTPDSLTGGFGRPPLVAGRYPARSSPDEIVVNERAANAYGYQLGQSVPLRATRCQAGCPVEVIGQATIVGVARLATDLTNDPSVSAIVVASPSFLDGRWRDVPGAAGWLGVHVRDRGDTQSVVADVSARLEQGDVVDNFATPDVVQRAGHLQHNALLVAAATVGVAGVLVVALALARHLAARSDDSPVLAALGLTPRQRRSAGLLAIGPALAGGLVGGVALAVTASPLLPLGLVRRTDPDVGVHLDVTVLGIGAAAAAIALAAIALIVAGRWATPSAPASTITRPALSTRLATGLGLRPVPATGVGLALDRGPAPVPVAATVLVLATATLVGALVVRWSLDGLVGTPDRYGEAWDLSVPLDADELRAGTDRLAADPRVRDAAIARSGGVNIQAHDGQTVRVATTGMASLAGSMPVTLLDGRVPAAPGEIALTTNTMQQLGLHLGDRTAAGGACRTLDTKVVGKVVIPNVGNPYPDDGSIITIDAFEELCAVDLAPEFNVEDVALIRLRDPRDATPVRDQWRAEGLTVDERVKPESIALIEDIRVVPLLVALLVAVLATAAAAHALVLAVRRRQADFAVLRAFGLRPRQAGSIVRSHAATLAFTAVVVGLPLGLVLGRVVWTALADLSRVFVHVDIDIVGLGLVVLAVAATAAVLSIWPAHRAARRRVADALRTE